MTTLNYLTIVTSLCTIAICLQLIARPSILGWPRRVARIGGAATMILAVLTVVLTITKPH